MNNIGYVLEVLEKYECDICVDEEYSLGRRIFGWNRVYCSWVRFNMYIGWF